MNALTVDTEEAARHLSLKPNTLEKMRTQGNDPRFVKLGRVVRYRIADLEAYIADRVVSSTSEKAAA